MTRVFDLDIIKQLEDPSYDQAVRVWQAAQYYVSLGMPVLPLRPNTKILPPKSRAGGISYVHAAVTARTVDKYFHPDSGQFAGWNVGIGCGREGGVFAIDVDVKPEGDGRVSLASLTKEHGDLPPTPTQRTPSGGEHYIFNWQDNCYGSTGKIGNFIDTRGGTADSIKSHIVVFPSIIDGARYQWIQGGPIADVPEWVMRRLGVPWVARRAAVGESGGGRGNEEVTHEDLEKQVPLEQIERMIGYIPIDDLSYDEWLQIGMAIHSQHPTDDGLKVWREWSKGGERYERRECEKRWDGFDGTGNIRIGTLFHFSKEGGWDPDPEDITSNPLDSLVARMNQDYGVIQVGGKVKILRRKKTTIGNQVKFELMDRDSFHALHANTKQIIVNPATGKAAYKTHAEVWMAHQSRRTYEEGIGLFPNSGLPGYFNVWQGYRYAAREGDISRFTDHVREIICDGNQRLTGWVFDWCAYLVQRPGDMAGTAIVLRGQEGAGKGLFATTIGNLFGAHFVHMIDEHHLTTNFNMHMLNAIVVYADEVVWGGQKKAASKLKGLVSEKYLLYEAKGVDAFQSPNHCHLIMATNEQWAVPAGPHSRRWLVLDVNNREAENPKYGIEFDRWRENGGYEALLHALMTRELTPERIAALRRAPETEAVIEQRELHMERDSVAMWWMEQLQRGGTTFNGINKETGEPTGEEWPEWVTKTDVRDDYLTWCNHTGNTKWISSPITLYRRLMQYGASDRPRGGDKGDRYRMNAHDRPYLLLLAPLEEMKKRFEKITSLRVD